MVKNYHQIEGYIELLEKLIGELYKLFEAYRNYCETKNVVFLHEYNGRKVIVEDLRERCSMMKFFYLEFIGSKNNV